MIFKSLFKLILSTRSLHLVLLAVTVFLFAFTETSYFRNDFDFTTLLSRYETLDPAAEYTEKIGIEIEGYYTEKRNTDGFISLSPYLDLIDLSQRTLQELGYRSFRTAPLAGKEKPDSIGLFFSSGERKPHSRLMFTPDPSIFHLSKTKPVEIVSPILENQQDKDAFFAILTAVNKSMQFTAEPLNSGTHFHFDFQNPKAEEILILTIVMEKILPELKTVFSIQPSRAKEYAQAYSVDDFKTLVHFTQTSRSLTETGNLDIHRHRSNNWLSLNKHGTFEFRAFNSTNDPRLLSIQADLIQKIVKAVRLRDPELIRLLKSSGLSLLTLKNITNALNCQLANPETEAYARHQAEKDVNYSKKIFFQLKPQATLSTARSLNPETLLNNPLINSMYAQRLVNYAEIPAAQNYASSNYTYEQIRIQTTLPTTHNRCVEFYK